MDLERELNRYRYDEFKEINGTTFVRTASGEHFIVAWYRNTDDPLQHNRPIWVVDTCPLCGHVHRHAPGGHLFLRAGDCFGVYASDNYDPKLAREHIEKHPEVQTDLLLQRDYMVLDIRLKQHLVGRKMDVVVDPYLEDEW